MLVFNCTLVFGYLCRPGVLNSFETLIEFDSFLDLESDLDADFGLDPDLLDFDLTGLCGSVLVLPFCGDESYFFLIDCM